MDQEYIRDEKEQERRKLVRLELKRKRQKQQRIVLGAGVLVLILLIILMFRGCANRRAEKEAEEARQAAQAAVQTETAAGIRVTVAAVGDIMCYENQMTAALNEDGSYNFAPSFAAIKPYLEGANLTVGNLELNFCGADAGYKGFPHFNAPESLAATLRDVGFDILQTANTYSLQNGINGLTSTIRYLTENDIDHLGTYHTAAAKAENRGVLLKNVNGIRIAFIGYTKGMNNMTLPADSRYSVDVLFNDYDSTYADINKASLLASVNAAKDLNADVIIAMLHWGVEYEIQPDEMQNEIADFLFSNGVDVILGSHSHEVGPMEKRTVTVNGEEKEVFIAYSLGNFYSSMTEGTSESTVILNLEFTMDAETGDTTISDVSYQPVYIADNGEGALPRYEVLPIRSAKASSAFADMTPTFNEAIATLKTNTGSNLDSGN